MDGRTDIRTAVHLRRLSDNNTNPDFSGFVLFTFGTPPKKDKKQIEKFFLRRGRIRI